MRSRYRWFVVMVFFFFMLLHQADKLLIGPLTTLIMEEFGINEAQMGVVFTGAIIVGAVFYPLWGILYDRYARAKLLALASLIWGATTWLSALAPTFPFFVATRASTGVDDSSYPGLYSLASDYFGPEMRGKVYGLLQVSMPLGYMLGLVLATFMSRTLGWRNLFFITGAIGIVLAVVIFLGVKEPPRGQTEPELAELDEIGVYRFDLKKALRLLRTPSWLLLLGQGFFGVIPWNVMTYWSFRYLETERGYSTEGAALAMAVPILTLSLGYFVGGWLGDAAFHRTQRGRILVSIVGVVLGAISLFVALNIPVGQSTAFMGALALTGFFMPFASPNVTATVHDITEPELRSTAYAIQSFVEQGGTAAAPLLAGIIAVRSSLKDAMLVTSVAGWAAGALLLTLILRVLPQDIRTLRRAMLDRRQIIQSAEAIETVQTMD